MGQTFKIPKQVFIDNHNLLEMTFEVYKSSQH